MYIMRGPPGSGKSYFSLKKLQRQLKRNVNTEDLKEHVLSTDDYFMVQGKYVFDPKKLPEYHAKNMERTELQMTNGVTPLFIDNTSIDIQHIIPYYDLAIKHNYRPVVTNMRNYNVRKYNPIWFRRKINRALLLKRAQERRDSGSGKDIPDDIIHKMCDLYESTHDGVVTEVDIEEAKEREQSLKDLGAAPGEWGKLDERKNVATTSGRNIPTQRLVAQYIAVFLDAASRQAIQKKFPAKFTKWHGSHITLAFRPSASQRQEFPVGERVSVKLKGYAHDDYVQTLAVSLEGSNVRSQNKIPHVTLSVSERSPYGPVYSNILLERLQKAKHLTNQVWEGTLPSYKASDGKVYPPTNAVYIPTEKVPENHVIDCTMNILTHEVKLYFRNKPLPEETDIVELFDKVKKMQSRKYTMKAYVLSDFVDDLFLYDNKGSVVTVARPSNEDVFRYFSTEDPKTKLEDLPDSQSSLEQLVSGIVCDDALFNPNRDLCSRS